MINPVIPMLMDNGLLHYGNLLAAHRPRPCYVKEEAAAVVTPTQQGPEPSAPSPNAQSPAPHCHQRVPPSPTSATSGREHQHHTVRAAATEPVRTDAVVPEGDDAAVLRAQELVDAGEMAGGVGAGAASPADGPAAGADEGDEQELLEDAARAAGDIAVVLRRLVEHGCAGRRRGNGVPIIGSMMPLCQ